MEMSFFSVGHLQSFFFFQLSVERNNHQHTPVKMLIVCLTEVWFYGIIRSRKLLIIFFLARNCILDWKSEISFENIEWKLCGWIRYLGEFDANSLFLLRVSFFLQFISHILYTLVHVEEKLISPVNYFCVHALDVNFV